MASTGFTAVSRRPRRGIGIAPLLLFAATALTVFGVIYFFSDESWFLTSSFLIIFLLCLIVGTTASALTSPAFVTLLFLSAFFIRVISSIFIYRFLYLYYGFHGFEGNDDLFWDASAKMLLSGEVSIDEALRKFFSAGYTFLVVGIYEIGGYNPLNPRIVNSLIGALIVIPTYHLAKELFNDERFSRRIAWWLALFPVMIIWSAAFQKDMLISLCMTVGAYACVRMYKRGVGVLSVVLLLSAALVAVLLRIFAGHTLIIMAVLALFYRAKQKSLVGGSISVVLVVALIFGVGGLVVGLTGRGEIVDFQGQYATRAEGFAAKSANIADRMSAQGVAARLTAAPMPVRLLVGPVLTLISPITFFDLNKNFAYSLLLIFQPLQLVLLPYFLIGLYRASFNPAIRRTGIVLLVPPILIALIANSFYIVGLINKYRIMIEPLLLLVAAFVFYSTTVATRLKYIAASIILMLGAFGSYFFLKYIL